MKVTSHPASWHFCLFLLKLQWAFGLWEYYVTPHVTGGKATRVPAHAGTVTGALDQVQ